MTEQINSEVQAESVSAPATEVSNVSSTPTAEEKFIPQSRVNELIGSTRKAARDEGYERARRELQESRDSMGGISQQVPEEVLDRIVNERIDKRVQAEREALQKQHTQEQIDKLADTFQEKLKAGYEKYPDFEKKLADLSLNNLEKAPGVVALLPYLAEVDNMADVLNEFHANPRKMREVLIDLNAFGEHRARENLKEIASSIQKNETAKNQYAQTPDIIGRHQPSITSMDNGQTTVSDERKNQKLKG